MDVERGGMWMMSCGTAWMNVWRLTIVKSPITLGLVHMGSQDPSPTHVTKSQHGGKVPTLESRELVKKYG